MKRAFRDTFNRELGLLKEQASEFAVEYPGLADRLGGLMEENLDPTVAGLLEGSAFLAARVQLKMQEEFSTFTHELLEQVFPDALAPTPAVMLTQANLPADSADILEGVKFDVGEYMDARFMDADKRVSCRFALAAPLTIWPVELMEAKYHAGAGPIGALGQEIASGTKAGLVLTLGRVAPSGKPDGKAQLNEIVGMDDITVHLTGPMPDAVALYEQVFCNLTRVALRWHDAQGDAVFANLPLDAVEQVGFERKSKLFAQNERLFNGFARLREYFVFPRKFLGFRLTGIADVIKRTRGSEVQIVLEFGQVNQKLAARLEPKHLALHAAPAVNLFEEMSSQVRVDRKHHEYIVHPNSSPATHYELHGITEVWAHFAGHQNKVRVYPLYALPPGGDDPRQVLYFTARRKPRRLTAPERRFGSSKYRYRGTETFISLYEPPSEEPVQRLQVKALCSNRHLPEYLPIAQSKDDFYMCEDQTVTLNCVSGPTPPRDALVDLETGAAHRTTAGDVYWRLISYLNLNHFGIDSPDGTEAAAALREMLSLFADLSENVTEAKIAGVNTVETRPVTRTIRHDDGYHAARGLEITLTFDEDEYESSGALLLGAVLDRFLSEYAAINSFTQTVVRSVQRGHIKTWPPRSGSGPIL
ncbi:MAG: type VI secretion system baseplate subunit TssF [Maritimibacter sp.]